MVGTTIAHYRVVARLGAGGMGEVYRATDTRLGRDVALKFLPPEMARDEAARARLVEEARSASTLNHPNICHIYEVNEADGLTYFAMELAEGEPLSRRIPPDGLPAETVARFGEQIAAALSHAHEHGILHRDLKSGNVMVTRDARVKVLDFGLAQRLPKEDLVGVTRSKITVQQASGIAGTLQYLAPEVLSGQRASERSDIWALGVMLYEMVSGAMPFEGRTGYELTSAILRESPRPLERTSPALRTVIQRCLAKEPGQRYQKAAEVRAALEISGSSSQAEVPRVVAPVKRRRVWAALAIVAVPALVVAIAQPWKRPPAPPASKAAPAGAPSIGTTLLIRRPSANPEANELMQRAMVFTRFQFDPERARPMLERALQLDPNFDDARVNLALTYIVALETGISNDPAEIYRAEEELQRVLKSDPEAPRAHALMGGVHFFQGRIDLAEESGQRAVRLAPEDLGGRMWRLIRRRFLGHSEDAMRAALELIQSEPLFWPPRSNLGELLREQGKPVEGVREQEKVLEQDPQNVSALRCLARSYLDDGKVSEARHALDRLRPEDHRNFRVRLVKAQLHALEGKRAAALKEMDEHVLTYADLQPFAALDAAETYALLGDTAKAVEWLDRSMRKGDGRVDWIRRDPMLAKLRDHPRFQQIVSSMAFRRQRSP